MSLLSSRPSTAPARAFAEAALALLVERMGTAPAELAELQSRLGGPPQEQGHEHAHEQASELARACSRLERDGWLFGMLARELGSDVLFERRAPRGLESAFELVRDILAREGVDADVPNVPVQHVAGDAQPELCAALALLAHAAGRERTRLEFARRGDEDCVEFAAPPGPGLERALLDAARRLAGSRLVVEATRAAFILPRASFAAP